MRLIDADKIDTRERGNNSQRTMWSNIKKIIDEAPTVEERPQGDWEFYEDDSDDTGMAYYRCSVCGRLIHAEEAKLLKNYPFCHCGANMRKGIQHAAN